jgi:hypothetical protein
VVRAWPAVLPCITQCVGRSCEDGERIGEAAQESVLIQPELARESINS